MSEPEPISGDIERAKAFRLSCEYRCMGECCEIRLAIEFARIRAEAKELKNALSS
jgi:hypothetical protein